MDEKIKVCILQNGLARGGTPDFDNGTPKSKIRWK